MEKEFILVSDTIDKINNPFVFHIQKDLSFIQKNKIYLIHGAEKASELDDFTFLSNKLNDNVYWFQNISEMEKIIFDNINRKVDIITILDIRDYVFNEETFYYYNNDKVFILNDDKIYHIDYSIISRLSNEKINFYPPDNFIGGDKIKVAAKEYGLLDEIYAEEKFINFLHKFNAEYLILFFFKFIYHNYNKAEYTIDNKYNNPYENILAIESYLSNIDYFNINLDKCDVYDLKYHKLPLKYQYVGFYNVTGRIYCRSDENFNLQTLPQAKRDVLVASEGKILVEIDYKSFEYDLLCQILNLPIVDDPHTEIYDRLVGVEVEDSRKIGKSINYSFIYGMNDNRLADVIMMEIKKLPFSFKEEFLEKLHEDIIYQKISGFAEDLTNESNGNVVVNYFGREIHINKDYAIVNNYISSTASDFFYNKMRQIIDILGDKNRILLQQHDSILLELDKNEIETTDLMENIIQIMSSPISGLIGRIDYKYGNDWKNLI